MEPFCRARVFLCARGGLLLATAVCLASCCAAGAPALAQSGFTFPLRSPSLGSLPPAGTLGRHRLSQAATVIPPAAVGCG